MVVASQTISVNELVVNDSPLEAILHGVMPAVRTLYVQSDNLEDLLTRPRVAIVGSRKVTPYGRMVTEHFATELARAGVVIVSGLAYGVDVIAHRAALDAGGLAIAVLPSALSRIYPSAHAGLANSIVQQGGALVSEYPPGSDIAYKNQFIERNRIVSGISDVLLITEAAVNSGTLHTARFALEQGKDVMAVPGNITSPASAGTNNLIKAGAMAVTSPDDVLNQLGLHSDIRRQATKGATEHEQLILDLLGGGVHDGAELLARSRLPVPAFNTALTMMELTGKVKAAGANQWSIR